MSLSRYHSLDLIVIFSFRFSSTSAKLQHFLVIPKHSFPKIASESKKGRSAALWRGGEVGEPDDGGISSLADFGGEVVEAVEALVVGGKFVGDAPGCEDEEGAACAGVEASALGLPVGADGFFLEVDDGQPLVDGSVDDDAFGGGDGGRDEDDALSGFCELSVAGGGEGVLL